MSLTSFLVCRALTDAVNGWSNIAQSTQSQPAAAAPAATTTTPKGVNTAVAAVAAMYNDKCKPAHEAAVQASQAVAGVRSALTVHLRQGNSRQDGFPSLASLSPAQIKSPGGSYRWGFKIPSMTCT